MTNYRQLLISTLIISAASQFFALGAFAEVTAATTAVSESPTQCDKPLSPVNVSRMLKDILADEPDQAFRGDVYKTYLSFAKSVGFRNLLPKTLVQSVIVDANNRYYVRVLQEALGRMASSSSGASVSVADRMRQALRETLAGKVNAASIDERIAALDGTSPDRVVRALGDMTLAEVQDLYYGADPLNPSKGSLIRQYLDETGASAIGKSFSNGPDKGGTFGPERLVVAVSEETFPIFQRLFTTRLDNLAPIGHAGIIQNGEMRGWHTGEMRMPRPGNILPTVLLKTTEAQRAEQYFKMMVLARTNGLQWNGWNNPMMQPWTLENYCSSAGAYNCCTHWIGNMPLGDECVSAYTFPPRVNNGQDAPPPIVAALKPYKHANAMVKRIWASPGHMQFGAMIGQEAANARGDMASPGWVITTLIGPTAVERVPVVFYFVQDAKAPLKSSMVPVFENPW